MKTRPHAVKEGETIRRVEKSREEKKRRHNRTSS
jgi:hypothetical protein